MSAQSASALFQNVPQADLGFPQSLTEAYKPKSISEFVGLAKHKSILSKLAANPRPCALLFFGGPGTGKTSIAFAFAKAVDSEVHHIGSQECKLETLQNIVATCHRVAFNFETGKPARFHAVLVDESDCMSDSAQKYLLSKLDGSEPCPQTIWILTANSLETFHDRFLSRLIQIPKFNGYGSGTEIRDLLSRIWTDRAGDTPMPDFSRVPTSNVREALMWLEIELLSV
ncbi:MAG: AAA family ATPase [Candidatus Micrarchaeaceae archaeon]